MKIEELEKRLRRLSPTLSVGWGEIRYESNPRYESLKNRIEFLKSVRQRDEDFELDWKSNSQFLDRENSGSSKRCKVKKE